MRNTPADAEIVSHQLLLRAGFIRRVSSGVYDYLPLALRVLRKIERIVREEMDAAGAQEVLLPVVQPAELWQRSGRWDKYGPELCRLRDRHGHEACLGPTHEEVICDLVARELRSYKQLPMNLYQIQSKFRDEIRPRFGLMRGREFIMKDAYSFHADEACLQREYERMYTAYQRIFERLGLVFRAVEADNGSIGGAASHEFHVLADSGEDAIAHCNHCDYAANVEKATSRISKMAENTHSNNRRMVDTPGATAAVDVAALLRLPLERLVKTMVYRIEGGPSDGGLIAACVRGNDEVQAVKLARLLDADSVQLANEEDIAQVGGIKGFVGPHGLSIPVWADRSLRGANGLVTGANQMDAHFIDVDLERDVEISAWADIRSVREGDACPRCDTGSLCLRRGIEVGHVFALGRCYSEPMQVVFQNAQGKREAAWMGCYGIGISRLMAAVIEQCHDEAGIAWPKELAPFHISLISLGQSDAVRRASETIYRQLLDAGHEVLWDDRKERPGVKFRDHELIGIPWLVVVGDRGLERDEVELSARGGEKLTLPREDLRRHLDARLRA